MVKISKNIAFCDGTTKKGSDIVPEEEVGQKNNLSILHQDSGG
jgi:hypothetical protein